MHLKVIKFQNTYMNTTMDEIIKLSKKVSQWNEQQTHFLIDLVKNQRHLWDKRDNLYRKRHLKKWTYHKIAETLALTFPESAELLTCGKYNSTFKRYNL